MALCYSGGFKGGERPGPDRSDALASESQVNIGVTPVGVPIPVLVATDSLVVETGVTATNGQDVRKEQGLGARERQKRKPRGGRRKRKNKRSPRHKPTRGVGRGHGKRGGH